jgi:hypothetical protein
MVLDWEGLPVSQMAIQAGLGQAESGHEWNAEDIALGLRDARKKVEERMKPATAAKARLMKGKHNHDV